MIYAANSMATVLLLSLLLGAFFGAVYDLIRFIRETFYINAAGKYKKLLLVLSNALTFVWDIIFFVFVGASVSIFLFYTNDGIFRLSSIIVIVGGFCLYRVTFGKIIYALLKFSRKILKKIVKISLKAIAFPVKSVYNIIAKISEHFSLSESGSIFEIEKGKGGDCGER